MRSVREDGFENLEGRGTGCAARTAVSILTILLGMSIFVPMLLNIAPPRFLSDDSTTDAARAAIPLAPLFTPEVLRWSNQIVRWAGEHGLDPNLVATVMQIESCGDPHAKSNRGAIGLFQVMSWHFEQGEDPWNPDTNARTGLAYLAKALRMAGGDVANALAGYNGGLSVIGRPDRWAAETRRYVYWGTGIYQDAKMGATKSARLEEWLKAGGRSLCKQAARKMVR